MSIASGPVWSNTLEKTISERGREGKLRPEAEGLGLLVSLTFPVGNLRDLVSRLGPSLVAGAHGFCVPPPR
jgi:hypothetical protein